MLGYSKRNFSGDDLDEKRYTVIFLKTHYICVLIFQTKFLQVVDADADAQEDYRTLRAREAEISHSVKVVEHGGGSAQPSSVAEVAHPFHPLPSPLPNGVIGVGESASTTSGSYPLQSEVHSIVNSNFGALQDVAQPAAQLADQSFAQPEPSLSPPR